MRCSLAGADLLPAKSTLCAVMRLVPGTKLHDIRPFRRSEGRLGSIRANGHLDAAHGHVVRGRASYGHSAGVGAEVSAGERKATKGALVSLTVSTATALLVAP